MMFGVARGLKEWPTVGMLISRMLFEIFARRGHWLRGCSKVSRSIAQAWLGRMPRGRSAVKRMERARGRGGDRNCPSAKGALAQRTQSKPPKSGLIHFDSLKFPRPCCHPFPNSCDCIFVKTGIFGLFRFVSVCFGLFWLVPLETGPMRAAPSKLEVVSGSAEPLSKIRFYLV